MQLKKYIPGYRKDLRQAAILFGASERDNVEEMYKELLEKITHMQSVLEAEGGWLDLLPGL